jgi:hypothetical protein
MDRDEYMETYGKWEVKSPPKNLNDYSVVNVIYSDIPGFIPLLTFTHDTPPKGYTGFVVDKKTLKLEEWVKDAEKIQKDKKRKNTSNRKKKFSSDGDE